MNNAPRMSDHHHLKSVCRTNKKELTLSPIRFVYQCKVSITTTSIKKRKSPNKAESGGPGSALKMITTTKSVK